ncbi:hypothetical protein J2J97_31735 (plasmid) [Rhizobium bangladeshense]|uniref:hypothetical protein n=1 Tax=Rhizobium bangladeshense TaxID=1138189 RepID=UPI001A98F7A5|nr:hypothetical protein [Rhizobium bangladeshense]QSY98643.1 hypothetical protein J2J97_31735 [Rhizobium bangladeshense]
MLSLLPLETPENCNCCTDPMLLRWHGIARKMEYPVTLEVLRDDGLYDEDGEDAFLDDELSIAAALSTAWTAAVAKVKPLFLKVFDVAFSTGNLQSAIDHAAPIMGNLYEGAAPEVEKAIRNTLVTGVNALGSGHNAPGGGGSVGDIPILSTPTAQQFESAIRAATRYSTNNFFNTQIVPGILRSIDAAFHSLDAPNLADLQAEIARHFRTVPYWQLIANVAASRGYHYGYLRTMQARGIIGYRFVAIIDGRTSTICRSMNGREFLVADAVNMLDALANDPDPMAAKTRTPWVSADAVEGKSSQELAKMGVMIPPLHPRCRSTINPIY